MNLATMSSPHFVYGSHHPEVLKTLLNQEGFRITQQRHKILEVLNAAAEGDHLSAEDIHQKLLDQGEKIGVSTIYRTLHLLVDLGLLRELALSEERKFYELSNPMTVAHHHLICSQCGSVKEFEDAAIVSLGQDEALRQGFSLLDCQFTVYGICEQCS
ncbi:MAG: Fur family transcriptional regulator [Cyanobacteria bacterium P01_H01_bin.162]